MFWVIVIFVGLIFGFSFYAKKYSNPYRLCFIFGKKGAGKSTLMVHHMLRDLKRGWIVYTDIQDVTIPGVRIIESSQLLSNFVPEPGSSLYLDEVGISWDNRNYKTFDPGIRDFFKLQRKYKCKVTMNSQSFDVDKKIRDTTDSMILQTAFGNVFTLSRPIIRSITLTQASAESDSRIADNLKFARFTQWRIYFMPKYFRYFKSFDAPVRPFIPWRDSIKEFSKSAVQALEEAEE